MVERFISIEQVGRSMLSTSTSFYFFIHLFALTGLGVARDLCEGRHQVAIIPTLL